MHERALDLAVGVVAHDAPAVSMRDAEEALGVECRAVSVRGLEQGYFPPSAARSINAATALGFET